MEANESQTLSMPTLWVSKLVSECWLMPSEQFFQLYYGKTKLYFNEMTMIWYENYTIYIWNRRVWKSVNVYNVYNLNCVQYKYKADLSNQIYYQLFVKLINCSRYIYGIEVIECLIFSMPFTRICNNNN